MAIDDAREPEDQNPGGDVQEALDLVAHEQLLREIVAESDVAPAGDLAIVPLYAFERWRVMAWRAEIHLVGYEILYRGSCVSAAILELDARARVGVSASGFWIVLLGPPESDEAVDRLLARHVLTVGVDVDDLRDVTAEVIPVPRQERTP